VLTVNAEKINALVTRGVDLLDAREPDWWLSINVGTLDVQNSRLCVLGQLYGDYDRGLAHLHLTLREAGAYGFAASTFDELFDRNDAYLGGRASPRSHASLRYRELTGAWRATLEHRRTERGAPLPNYAELHARVLGRAARAA